MSFASIPKTELHLHLEGAAPPAFIAGLAREKGVDLGGIFNADGSYKYQGFDHFLKVYEAACTVLTSPEDFRRLTLAVLEESAANGVIYGETFLSPDFCGKGDLGAWREYLAAITEAASEAEARDGVTLKGVVTCIRHFGPEQARTAARCAAETMGDFIVGFGIGGDEMAGKLGDFAYSFDMAREAGLHLTAHAGEWGGPESVRDAVNDLGVARVGHGVRSIEDPAWVEELARRGVHLEICPGSNISLGVFPDWPLHPINTFYERGVSLSISTDDPPFFHTTLAGEYERLAETFDWDEAVFRDINIMAMKAAFCDDATRAAKLETLGEKT